MAQRIALRLNSFGKVKFFARKYEISKLLTVGKRHANGVAMKERLIIAMRSSARGFKAAYLRTWWVIPIALMGVIFWLFYWGYFPLEGNGIEERGQFGDSFGVLNSLFTGLGFGGLVVTLLLQQKQLRQQEEEIKLQRQGEETKHYEETLHRLMDLYASTLAEVANVKGDLKSRALLRGSVDRCFEAIKREKANIIPHAMQRRYDKNQLTDEDRMFLDYLYFRNFKILSVEIDRQGRLIETLKVLLHHLVNRVPSHLDPGPYRQRVSAQLTYVEISYFVMVALAFNDEAELRDLLLRSGLLQRAAHTKRLRVHDYMYEEFWSVSIRSYKRLQVIPIDQKRINAAIRAHKRLMGPGSNADLESYSSPRTRKN